MQAGNPRVLLLCLNPAWQRTVVLASLVPGAVNRAASVVESGGGKGVNAARAARIVGARVTVALFAGGHTGDLLLEDLRRQGIDPVHVPVPGATRICTTLVDEAARRVTEIIEPSAAVTPAAVDAMAQALAPALAGVDGVALCGTCPPGVPQELYGRVASAARRRGLPVVLDSVRDVDETLRGVVDVLKINADELRGLSGREDVGRGAADLIGAGAARWIAITDGPRDAFLFGNRTAYRLALPDLAPIRNPIGAGDCATALLLAGIAGNPIEPDRVLDAFAHALAAASASCRTELPASFEPRLAARLRAATRIQRMEMPDCRTGAEIEI
ncbi:MAG: hypothetical protein JXR77_10900 [Lentisphaeria bacterium]|nr:hypothetical protein [Lentisphaeria bacterium]